MSKELRYLRKQLLIIMCEENHAKNFFDLRAKYVSDNSSIKPIYS